MSKYYAASGFPRVRPGDFVYHCHILNHEDGGMMAIIRVAPASGSAGTPPA